MAYIDSAVYLRPGNIRTRIAIYGVRMPELPVNYDDIVAAAQRIKQYIHRTPVLTSRQINKLAGADLFFKAEPLQKTGSFKPRGATNAVFMLSDDDARKGVATHSSGNFAAGLAQAAAWRGIQAHVVMPTSAPTAKRKATEGYGARIIPCEPTLASRESTLAEVVEKTGATFLHPYNDERVIAGQGTAGLELLDDVPDLQAVLVPVGGGGLCSGISIAVHAHAAHILMYGVEPERADDAKRSLEAGSIQPSHDPDTIADGLKTSLGDKTFPILKHHLKDILLVSERQIREAQQLIWSRMKIVVEPSGAVVLAAVLANRDLFSGQKVGLVLSGGNVDVNSLL